MRWNDGTLSEAIRAWGGRDQPALNEHGDPPWNDPAALCLSRPVTIEPYSIRTVYGQCETTWRCLLTERPIKMAEKCILMHNVLADVKTRRNFMFFLTNITSRPVSLPKGYAVGLAEPYPGPFCGTCEELCQPLGEGADQVGTLAEDPGVEIAEAPRPELYFGRANGASDTAKEERARDQGGPKMPQIAYDFIPAELYEAVRDLVGRYKG